MTALVLVGPASAQLEFRDRERERPETEVPTAVERRARQELRTRSPDLLETPIDPETYVLGPQDILVLMLVLGETRTEELPVLSEGVVLVPNVGPVQAAGRTLAEFRGFLRSAVSKRYRDFELYCYLAQARLFRVYVTGEVQIPGMLAVRAYERVSDVIDRAGGFTEHASRRQVEIWDNQGVLQTHVDLAAFEARGDLASNPHLAGGAVVRVPVRQHEVEILGAVGVPGVYESKSGEGLLELLELAGGPTPYADLSQVSVEAIDTQGGVRVGTYDLRHESPRVEDVVRVSLLSSLLGQRRVFVLMPNNEERVFLLSPDETLHDLLRRTAQLEPQADLGGAVLLTRDDKNRRSQRQVDLGRVLAGDEDHVLHDGDVLSVPRVKDYVYVSGHVANPGRYVYRAEWTVNDYLGAAGGPTAGGSRDRVAVLSADGKKRNRNREAGLERGDTIFVDRSFTGKSAGVLGLLANFSTLIISIVVLAR